MLITTTYPTPFPITMSGLLLGGTVGNGIAYDPNGQLTRIDSASPTSKNFTIAPADTTNPRWDLLVIRYKQTGDTPVPKPSDPITTINLNLHDDFELAVVEGTASPTPAYPAKGALDIILAGLKVPANATLGTSVTVDLSIRERSGITASRVVVDTSQFQRVLDASDQDVQTCLNDIDAQVNKFFGQLLLTPHPTLNHRAVITAGDVSMKDGTTRSLVIDNFLIDFDGAQIEFSGVDAGKIFASDGITQIGTFSMPVIATNKWRWFSVSVIPGALTGDNRMSISVNVQASATDGTTQNGTARAEFYDGIALGQVAVQASGPSAVQPITKTNIVLLNPSEEMVGVQADFEQETIGIGDGTTTDFNLSKPPLNIQSILIFIDGVQRKPVEASGTIFTITGQTVSVTTAPGIGIDVVAYYIAQGLSPLSGFQETPTGAIDGFNDTFALSGVATNKNSTLVFVDGSPVDKANWDLTIGSTNSMIKFHAGFLPQPAQDVYVWYLVNAATIPGMGPPPPSSAPRTTNHVNSNFAIPTLTSDYMLDVDTSGGPINISLPDAIVSLGRIVYVKNVGSPANPITVSSSQPIDGNASDTIAGHNEAHTYGAIDSEWKNY